MLTISLAVPLLPVRDQGYRPTCLAFAASEVHSVTNSLTDWLSPEYLYQKAGLRIPGWSIGKGLYFKDTYVSLLADGQPLDSSCPYQSVVCPQVIAVATQTPVFKSNAGSIGIDPKTIYQKAFGGSAIVLGLQITDQFHAKIAAPYIIDTKGLPPKGGHAMVLSGLALDEKGTMYFRVKNSWGTAWGDAGHVWLTYGYLKQYLYETLTIIQQGIT